MFHHKIKYIKIGQDVFNLYIKLWWLPFVWIYVKTEEVQEDET